MFIAIHKWKKEDFPKVAKKVMEALTQVPEGMRFIASWSDVEMIGSWCIWEAESAEGLQKFLRAAIPDTEVKQVLRYYPPSEDLYQMLYQLLG